MTGDEIAAALPSRPRRGMAEAVASKCEEQLGPQFCVYRRASSAEDAWDEYSGWPGLDEPERKGHWVAKCRCGACGESWRSGWVRGPKGGIAVPFGEDGLSYPGEEEWCSEIAEGDSFPCPFCDTDVELIHAKKLAAGRTYRVHVGSLENVGEHSVVVLWAAERYVHPDGDGTLSIAPKSAVAIGCDGRLMFFRWDGGWTPRQSTEDPFQMFYGTYGSPRTLGAWLWDDVPEQLGQTGEKTGLADYFRAGGRWPVMYLRFRQRFPQAENLLKSGWWTPFEDAIDNEVARYLQRQLSTCRAVRRLTCPTHVEFFADWERVRPHEMLRMTRQEVRDGRPVGWDNEMQMLWMGCTEQAIAAPGDVGFFAKLRSVYGIAALQKWADMAVEGRVPATLDKIDRYLERQEKRHRLGLAGALTMYLDYIEMLDDDAPDPIQIYPPDLRAAHDRLVQSAGSKASAKLKPGFLAAAEKWRALEWSDGAICAVLPKDNSELIAEGKALCHCVGGYGEAHTKGKLIVFIRHARRPERSWFTLNIDTTGVRWREIQLHGYGNEWAHGHSLHIPREVRDFVDRWEREVLTPVFDAVKAGGRKTKEGSKKREQRHPAA